MKLLFVYNADGSFGAAVRDTVKKIATPQAQECNLCAITYPLFAMDKRWSEFTKSLPYEVAFFHRDEFHAQYPDQKETPLPAVFAERDGTLDVLVHRDDINTAQSVAGLIALVQKGLAASS